MTLKCKTGIAEDGTSLLIETRQHMLCQSVKVFISKQSVSQTRSSPHAQEPELGLWTGLRGEADLCRSNGPVLGCREDKVGKKRVGKCDLICFLKH